MSRFLDVALATALLAAALVAQAQSARYPGIGRDATPKEVAAWDIDVRPDFKGLPAGAGSVARGQEVWEAKCAHCHGIFGESGEVFNPLIGGTTAEDIRTGRVANLRRTDYPGRTTLMKVPTVSTLWDYINRAMPWNVPKSLSTEEVYAVTAFMLNLGGIVSDNFVLSDQNIADVQQRMPNRHGMTLDHALWPGKEFGNGGRKPDTKNVACMKDCVTPAKVSSYLPDYARDAHGNLADQNRLVGPQRGADTTKPGPKGMGSAAAVVSAAPPAKAEARPSAKAEGGVAKAVQALLSKYSCTACHAMDKKMVGPSFKDIASKHAGKADYLADKIRNGGSGVWGPIPMPSQALSEAQARTIAVWLASGADR
ncbi:MAG: c-type cytochrome [Curvibacter sp.]|jgi:cytochrome c|nr:c-type cytochrome [Curvibacter sp.]